MKHIIIITGLIFSLSLPTQAQEKAQPKEGPNSFSISKFFYKVTPILEKKEKAELKQELSELQRKIDNHMVHVQSLGDSILMGVKLDTVDIPPHFTAFWGAVEVPRLSPLERAADELQREIAEVDKEISELKNEIQKIHNTFKRDKKYVEKNILLGFIQWDSKKDSSSADKK
jgi:hypothetical protein